MASIPGHRPGSAQPNPSHWLKHHHLQKGATIITSSTPAGLFVAFEGGDGAGKSTQVTLLTQALTRAGHTVLRTREPGGTPIGEKLRSLVLDHGQGDIDAKTETLIFAAARAAHAEQVIRPALNRGEIVISDRYIDSSIAYQGVGRTLGAAEVQHLNEWATTKLWPKLTVLLDVSPTEGRNRRAPGTEDRMESESDQFHDNIRTAFLDRAKTHPQRYLVLDAKRPVEELAQIIQNRIMALLQTLPTKGN